MMRRRHVVAALAGLVALGLAASLPFLFPSKAVLSALMDSRLRQAEIEVDWGATRYAFPRSIVMVGSSFRARWGGRPVEVKVDRATVTPHLSSLWGAPSVRVAAEIGGGAVSLDVEAGRVRSVRFVAQDLPLERFPTGLILPWDIRGVARGSGTLRWTGSLAGAEGALEWQSGGTEFRGVRWLGATWPLIRAEHAEGKITLSARQLDVDFRSAGGNCPFEAVGAVSLRDRLNESPVDLTVRIQPEPEMLASLSETGALLERARTVEGGVSLGIEGPLETAEVRIR